MCLIVEKKIGDVLVRRTVEQWHSANQDGWGIMYPHGSDVVVLKGMGAKHLWRTIQSLQGRAYYLHLRMATHGIVNDSMTHPYLITAGIYLMHNGIVDIDTAHDAEKSDTWHWVESVLRPMLESLPDANAAIRSPWFRSMVESFGGKHNRFVFMDRNGAVTMNDSAWHTFPNGLRVSNTYALGGFFKSIAKPVVPKQYAITAASSYDNWVREEYQTKQDWWQEEDDFVTGDHSTIDEDEDIEGDFRYLIGLSFEDIEHFTYAHPVRAAAVLHSLVAEN